MDNYDVIVVGAGNSGLVSALYLLKKGYKVLLLEQQNKIGGLNQTMIKGRFEFDMSLFNYFIDSKKEDYSIKNIFEELGIESDLEFSKIPEAFRVITREGGDIPARDITMPIGIENFISKMEQIVKDSETAVRTFFELALECKEALEYIMNTNEIDYDYIKENYNNFMRVAPYSLSKVLDIIDMPLEAQEILNTYWIYLGSPETEITFAQYAAFVYEACKLNEDNPTEAWKKVEESQESIKKLMDGTKTLHIKGLHTDLTMSVEGRIWENCCGYRNMPDGEVFTSPVETSAEGTIFFDIPTTFNGVEAKNVFLRFERGLVVEAKAEKGQDFLHKMLEIDDGARFAGEIAFGLNDNITIPTKNILFDEKIGRSMHLAIGASYESVGGKNKSALHWDLIKDMKNGGTVEADGKLVYKDGKHIL